MKQDRLVSIIIPTLDNSEFIGRTIDSVLNQTYQNIEIIIVGVDSFQNIDKVLPKSDKIKKFLTQKGRSKQKNYGAKVAKGEFLYFIDADFLLDEKIVASCLEQIDKGYDMVEVHNTSDASVSFWAKVRKFERDMLIGDAHNISPRFIRKEAFEDVAGFNEDMIASEDYDIYNRLRGKGFSHSYSPYHEMHLDEPRTIGDIMKKHFFYGQTMNGGQEKTMSKITFWQKSPIKLAYIKNFHKFFLNPVLSLGLAYYNFVRYAAAALGYLNRKFSEDRVEDKEFVR